ncbi:MAG: ribosome-associated translation inhibitor RaiA [Parcubacteria group bacterium]|nr:ribosome-associated translation inhibitor RaiA [Parcubacteria group bacterium]
MKITIKTTNVVLNQALEDYIEKKIAVLDKYVPKVGYIEAWVEIGKPSKHHKKGDVFYAEADIRLPGKILRSEAKSWDLKLAIDAVKDELQIELKKYKEVKIAKERGGGRKAKEWPNI